MQVFREGQREIDVAPRLRALRDATDPLDALLRAGELECALDDAGDPTARALAAWTDAAADALITGGRVTPPPMPCPAVARARASVPEGFAYYGLHPLDHGHAARRAVPAGTPALVLGLRTIGATLSAIAAAALRARGDHVVRATVRPTGHPFDRRVELTPELAAAARAIAAAGGLALVVDEGPGLSGSSFLGAADALVSAGVPRERIVLVPSHAPDVDRLRAPEGPSRWRAHRVEVATPTRAAPEGARVVLTADGWRAAFLPERAPWPATWPSMERRKHLAHDGALLKLEGLACFGDAPFARAELLAAEGISPRATRLPDGYLRWERAPGRPLALHDPPPIATIARAVAARLALAPPEADVAALERATEQNLRVLLGVERRVSLPLARPAVCDGRLAPHEWIADAGGIVRKVDAISHGDDHFYPGPCDVAWDLAGAIVEWQLDAAHAAGMLDHYARATGDHDAARRVPPWTLAYAAFRAAWLAMARDACAGTGEHARLAAEADRLRASLARHVAR